MTASSIPIDETSLERNVIRQFKSITFSEKHICKTLKLTIWGSTLGRIKLMPFLLFIGERKRKRNQMGYETALLSPKYFQSIWPHAQKKVFPTTTYRLCQGRSGHLHSYTCTTNKNYNPFSGYCGGDCLLC